MDSIFKYLQEMYDKHIDFHMFIKKDTWDLDKRIVTFQEYIEYVMGYSITRESIYIILVGLMPESDLEKIIILSLLDKTNKYTFKIDNVRHSLLFNRLKTTETTSDMFHFK